MRFIDEVCNLYDCDMLCDLQQQSAFLHMLDLSQPMPDPVDPDALFVKSVVFIGSRAGEISFVMTPVFNSMEELEAFCNRHIERFRSLAENPDAPAPDATEWDLVQV